MEQRGMSWWNGLSAREKENVVEPMLDRTMSSGEITAELGLKSRNSVITVRARISKQRKEKGLSMDTWMQNTGASSSRGHRRRPRVPRPPEYKGSALLRPDASHQEGAFHPSAEIDPRFAEETAALRRRRGPPPMMSSRERRERGLVDQELPSHMPKPGGDLTAEDIRFLDRMLYRDK